MGVRWERYVLAREGDAHWRRDVSGRYHAWQDAVDTDVVFLCATSESWGSGNLAIKEGGADRFQNSRCTLHEDVDGSLGTAVLGHGLDGMHADGAASGDNLTAGHRILAHEVNGELRAVDQAVVTGLGADQIWFRWESWSTK
jgi:hypothetical protein